jgi:photosystem II stability/assembly factor-like uncharacterized protein
MESAAAGSGTARHAPSWELLSTGSTSHFRGLSPVSRRVAWISGYSGLVMRTVDGGRSWADVSPAEAAGLQFRDISAFDARHAVAMAAGSGTDSRLYATADGGQTWRLAYQNSDPAAFFDCMSFSDARHGLVVSDPVDGKFRILSTRDGGRDWNVLPDAGMPAALSGEAGFAASGECLTTSGRDAWFGSGGGSVARIFHSADRGLSWEVSDTPLTSSQSAGVFGVAFRSRSLGIAVGGDFSAPAESSKVAAVSYRNGPWLTPRAEPSGYRSGVTFIPRTAASAIAVGLNGSDISDDGGRHWRTFDTGQFDTVSCAKDGSCWASGDLGRVAVLKR